MKAIVICLALFSAAGSYAQDQLFKKDNSKTEVQVLEVGTDYVKYKLFSYPDGPTVKVLKSEVALIIYQDGKHETFPVDTLQQQKPVLTYRNDLEGIRAANRRYSDSLKRETYRDMTNTHNLVSIDLLELANKSIGLSYLREFSDGLFHVYVPVSVGLSEPLFNQPANTMFGSLYYDSRGIYNFKFNRKTIGAGLGIHFHSSPEKRVTHVIGPYIGIAQYTGGYDYIGNMGSGPTRYIHNTFVMNRYTFMLDNGFLFRVHKNFNMLLLGGFGYRSDDYMSNNPKNHMHDYSNSGFIPFDFLYKTASLINTVKLNFSMGYRF